MARLQVVQAAPAALQAVEGTQVEGLVDRPSAGPVAPCRTQGCQCGGRIPVLAGEGLHRGACAPSGRWESATRQAKAAALDAPAVVRRAIG